MPGIQSQLYDTDRVNLAFMPENDPDSLVYLFEKRADILRRIRDVAPELEREFTYVEEAIEALRAQRRARQGEYSTIRSGADAIAAHLHKVGPTARQDAARAVAQGGWAPESPDAYWKLIDAIAYQLGKKKGAKIISLGGDMIGLPEHKRRR